MKENFGLFGILAKVEAVAAKVRIFFATLAKVEAFYFFPFGSGDRILCYCCRLSFCACIWCVS